MRYSCPFFVSTACLCLTLSACTGQYALHTPYPKDWIPRLAMASCSDFAGSYDWIANAAEPERSARAAELVPLIERGAFADTELQRAGTQVVTITIDGQPKAEIRTQDDNIVRAIVSAGNWSCTDEGSLHLEFPPFHGGGESSLYDKSRVVIDMYLSQDRSLALHWAVQSRGISLPAGPYKESIDSWIRFAKRR